ncbi:hypothetical protein [uncultured Dechloromonas sp.]|uniref:hypothetical protein n=1 Tax=uncultured Dechloromonas sp. TaxID=171719 RepID=UPI0025D20797|nr:hypothetical protein [uncultured Dechloromonas sp.]
MDSERPYQQFGHNALGRPPQGPLAKLLAFVLSAAFLVLAFMFSLVALAVVAVLGLVLGGWLWWRTRKLRQEINRQRAEPWDGMTQENPFRAAPERSSTVIDGEATRIAEEATGGATRRLEN